MSFIIAVDGPSGTGKGTITKLVSEKFNFQYLDTGAMYRCVTLKMINEKVSLENEEKLVDDHTIMALTIMIAESNPEEKEMMISVVMNCMK